MRVLLIAIVAIPYFVISAVISLIAYVLSGVLTLTLFLLWALVAGVRKLTPRVRY